MYISYGWPKLLKAIDAGDDEVIVHISIQKFLVVVSTTCIQVWASGQGHVYIAVQHRVKLADCYRDPRSLADDGGNLQAVWNASVETLAVLTASNILHFYDIIETDEEVKLAGQESSGLKEVRIKFRSSTNVPLFGESVTINGIVGDDDNLLLGLSNGRLHLVSWRGQLRGTVDLWRDGIPATPMPPTPTSPLQAPLANGKPAAGSNPGVAALEYCAALRLLVAVLLDGRVVLCSTAEKGLRPVEGVTPGKWVAVNDAVCAAVGARQQVLAVGTRRGTVELFTLSDNGTAVQRSTISLVDWGYPVEDTGPVSCIRWTPDNWAFAVGWRQRGLAVWSVSGCRLMCTIRQGSVSHVHSGSPRVGALPRNSEPMVTGVSGVAWGTDAYQLVGAEGGSAARLVQFCFAKGCLNKAVAGSAHVWQLMQAEDRVLLIQSDEEGELKLQHLVVPQMYMRDNWPLTHVAANQEGSYLAVAGQRGMVLYNLRSKKWRVFGDVMQERAIRCVGLLWLGKLVAICNHRTQTDTYELLLYPRFHLDDSSLLFRQPLAGCPVALDSWQDFILVAHHPFDLSVYHCVVEGEVSPLRRPSVHLRKVRELSVMSARKPVVAMRFLPRAVGAAEVGEDAVLRQPVLCMLLRTDGSLSLLDLDSAGERPLVAGVEHFWLTQGRPKEEAALIEEVPWWAYGQRGMQVWYPSAALPPSHPQLDPELDFDREVYPLGVSPAAGVIVGISQRLALSAGGELPCFEPTPQAQPILPCLLRHLLQRSKLEEAVELARLSATRPHFSHSLEWLLFTVFDADTSSKRSRRRQGDTSVDATSPPSMLVRACHLIRHFPEYLEVVVSVARKTDGRHWADLFAAAGVSTDLFEECFERRQYRTATCYILVIDKLEGPVVGQQCALRLLQVTLEAAMYELAGELVRFLLRSGRESSSGMGKEEEGLLHSLFHLTFTPSSANATQNALHGTVAAILGAHAQQLLARRELREVVGFVKGTHFDLSEFLQCQRGTAPRLDDFPTRLKIVRLKLGADKQSRSDAEFLLAHFCSAGFSDWTVVLATLLRRVDVLLNLFHDDAKLWAAYRSSMQSYGGQFGDVLAALEAELHSLESASS